MVIHGTQNMLYRRPLPATVNICILWTISSEIIVKTLRIFLSDLLTKTYIIMKSVEFSHNVITYFMMISFSLSN